MRARTRIFLLAGTLLMLAALLVIRKWSVDVPPGMTDRPCSANGGPVTGDPKDDWARLCGYRLANAEMLKSDTRPGVVMIGDSITARSPFATRNIVNRGIAGQTSAQVMARFQQDAIALKPQVIHILVGINDVSGNAGPVSPDMFKDNIRAMVDMAEAHGITVILGTIPPARGFFWKPEVKPGFWVPMLNAWLAQYAREKGLILADYHAALSTSDGRIRQNYFTEDGVHPNAAGYAAMKPVLLDAVERADEAKKISSPPRARSAL